MNNEIAQTIMRSYIMQYGRIGCTDEIHQEPIHLLQPVEIFQINNNLDAPPPLPPKLFRYYNRRHRFLRLYFGKHEKKNWAEESKRNLSSFNFLNDLWVSEIFGNSHGIIHQFCIDKQHSDSLCTIIKSIAPENEICVYEEDILQHYVNDQNLHFKMFDYYPTPPFFENSLTIESCDRDPFLSLHEVLSMIPQNAIAGLQILIEPIQKTNEMKRIISRLLGLQQEISSIVSLSDFDSDWSASSNRNISKLDPVQNLYSTRFRTFVFAKKNDIHELSRSLFASMQIFSTGSRKYRFLSEKDYEKAFDNDLYKTRQMICKRLSYSCGCITSQSELAALCHFPSEQILSSQKPLDRIVGFKIPEVLIEGNGPEIGVSLYADKEYLIKIPENCRCQHCDVMGTIRTGKTTLEKTAIINDIKAGRGVGFIYPHEKETVDEILSIVEKDRLIYIDMTIEDYTVAYNHFHHDFNIDPGKLSNDAANNIRALFTQYWGPSMDSLFRHGFYALSVLPESNLYDLFLLLDLNNRQGDILRSRLFPILQKLENPEPLRFWTHDLPRYKADLKPILNKFSALFLNSSTARTYSYRGKSKFNLRQAMDESKVVIIYAPAGILGDAGDFDCSLFISDFYHAAMSRSKDGVRTPFHLYIDELHRYSTSSIGDILRESSKFGLYLTIANQQRSQLSQQMREELKNIGNFIAFRTNFEDAKELEHRTAGKLNANDIVSLENHNFIAYLDDNLIRGNTIVSSKTDKFHVRDVIEYCKENYYIPSNQITFNIENSDSHLKKNSKRAYDTI
jgi:hypothetical protein